MMEIVKEENGDSEYGYFMRVDWLTKVNLHSIVIGQLQLRAFIRIKRGRTILKSGGKHYAND